MKKNKYYQPEISELYVGYETYWIKDHIKELTDDNLIPFTLTSKKLASTLFPPIQWEHEDTDGFIPNLMSLRSKYLDSDDIISLGFKETARMLLADMLDSSNDEINVLFEKDSLIILYNDVTHKIVIKDFGREGIVYFQGSCKSKNELKKILEWI